LKQLFRIDKCYFWVPFFELQKMLMLSSDSMQKNEIFVDLIIPVKWKQATLGSDLPRDNRKFFSYLENLKKEATGKKGFRFRNQFMLYYDLMNPA